MAAFLGPGSAREISAGADSQEPGGPVARVPGVDQRQGVAVASDAPGPTPLSFEPHTTPPFSDNILFSYCQRNSQIQRWVNPGGGGGASSSLIFCFSSRGFENLQENPTLGNCNDDCNCDCNYFWKYRDCDCNHDYFLRDIKMDRMRIGRRRGW